MFKGNITFSERKKKLFKKYERCVKGKSILRRKEKFVLWIFRIKEKLILWIYGSKGISFSTQEVDRKMIFP